MRAALSLLVIGLLVADPASASAVRPCREPVEAARLLGDQKWIEACARGATAPAAIRRCRDWLAACRKNPQHPLPSGTNSL